MSFLVKLIILSGMFQCKASRTMRALFFLLLSLMLGQPSLAGFYKWVDEEGNVHYSDKIPPSAVRNPHAKLDERGLVIERKERAKTPEEIAREAELKRLREEQQRMLEEQKARDKVLLNTFRSEDDILLARDGKLATYNAQIRIAYTNIERLKKWLETQKKKAAALERKGRKLPGKLLKEIENTRLQIKSNYESILRQERDKETIRRKYAADLARFRELKKLKTESAQKGNLDGRRHDAIVETVIVCDERVDCDKAWQEAKAYARQHANTPIYVNTDKMFMTQPPRQKTDVSITVTRLHPDQNQPELIFMDVSCKKQVANQTWCDNEQARMIRNKFREAVLGKE